MKNKHNMNAESYYISIQWGKGPHYFVTAKPIVDKTEAILKADTHLRRLKRELKPRGALPTVRLLKLDMEVGVER